MTLVAFEQLPADARLWIFGTSDALDAQTSAVFLDEVDAWLSGWQAHGHPLTCAREWREGRFLVVGVDQNVEGASGCSIDALYRILIEIERSSGISLLAGGRVFYRDSSGAIACVDRETFAARARTGEVQADTTVFDTSIIEAGRYRDAFELPLAASWHSQFVSA